MSGSTRTSPSHGHRTGSGEPLVLIHGVGSSWRVWTPVIEALAAHHDVVALDLPGFGAARPLRSEASTVPALTDAVEAELAALGIETVHVVGNSMGGWIGLELGRRGRARSVVAISPAGLGTERENRVSRAKLASGQAMARAIEPAIWRLTGRAATRTLVYGLATSRPWRMDRRELAHALRALARSPAFAETLPWLFANRAQGLEKIGCPVTVVWGTWDQILPVRQAERFGEAITHARVVRLPRLGHVPMSDDPELVAQVILEGVG